MRATSAPPFVDFLTKPVTLGSGSTRWTSNVAHDQPLRAAWSARGRRTAASAGGRTTLLEPHGRRRRAGAADASAAPRRAWRGQQVLEAEGRLRTWC